MFGWCFHDKSTGLFNCDEGGFCKNRTAIQGKTQIAGCFDIDGQYLCCCNKGVSSSIHTSVTLLDQFYFPKWIQKYKTNYNIMIQKLFNTVEHFSLILVNHQSSTDTVGDNFLDHAVFISLFDEFVDDQVF